jgi:integrase/recombinase XerD
MVDQTHGAKPPAEEASHVESASDLSSASSLRAAINAFEVHMHQEGFTQNTIKAFLSDLNILSEFTGDWTSIGDVSRADLNRFTDWLVDGRDAPCSPKSLARRITTLKVFFGWLEEEEVLPRDPAAPLVHKPVTTPLPDILTDEQVERVLDTTQTLREAEKPDARPHLLVTLLLHTGIKKSECMNIVMNHFNFQNPERPIVWIRYTNPERRHKERKIPLPTWWPSVLEEYKEQYQPKEMLFSCTARNLEYVLSGIAEKAGLEQGISFEMLRWTCAVRDYQSDMPAHKLRRKMGLSKITWRETKTKLAKLADQA